MQISLHPKQGLVYKSQATEILFGGSAGPGKSFALRALAIIYCRLIPGLNVYLFRRIFPDLYKNHMEGAGSFPVMLGEWVNQKIVKINYSSNEILFDNGSKIFLCHCQHEKNKYDYQGAEIHVLMIDELTQFSKSCYEYLRGRVRLGGLQIPDDLKHLFPRVICGTNPGGIGHSWVRAEFVDIAPAKEIVQMAKERGGMKRQYIPALLEDNPTMLKNDPEYENRLLGLGNPELVKAMRYGDWNIVAGGMFDDVFIPEKNVLEPFKIPPQWEVYRAFDWGSSKPFSVGWWTEADGSEVRLADGKTKTFFPGTVFRIAEWYGWNGNPNEGIKATASEIAREIQQKEIMLGSYILPGPADTAIFDVENGKSIADDMQIVGIRWERAHKAPGSRIRQWEKCRAMLKAAHKVPMEEPGMFIFSTCTQWLRTVPTVPRDEKHIDDIETQAEDHICDEMGYFVIWKKPVMEKMKIKM